MFLRFLAKAAICAVFAILFSVEVEAQAKRPKRTSVKPAAVAGPTVTRIDIDGLRSIITPKDKPLLINFWATWCDPCREEFPDLVKIDQEFKGKIDFVTVSLDDLAEIKTSVPKFLREVKAEMPAYLLRTADESAAIALVAKDWSGNLPMTVLFAPSGAIAYIRMGVVKHDVLTAEIGKLLAPPSTPSVISPQTVVLPTTESTYTYVKGQQDAARDAAASEYKILRYGLTAAIPAEQLDILQSRFSVTVKDSGCVIFGGYDKYVWGYNSTMISQLERKYGPRIREFVAFATTSDPAAR